MSNTPPHNHEHSVHLTLSPEQARANVAALDLYTRLACGRFDEIAHKIRLGELTPYEGTEAPRLATQSAIEAPLLQLSYLMGLGPHCGMGVSHANVTIGAKRAYEIERVLSKALAEHKNPTPEFSSVDYDGLTARYTQDPTPACLIQSSEAGNAVTALPSHPDGRDWTTAETAAISDAIDKAFRAGMAASTRPPPVRAAAVSQSPPVCWYRDPIEPGDDGEASYGSDDPNIKDLDTGWLPAFPRAHASRPPIPPELLSSIGPLSPIPPPRIPSEFELRGILARLQCWHRLSHFESENLLGFFHGVMALPGRLYPARIGEANSFSNRGSAA